MFSACGAAAAARRQPLQLGLDPSPVHVEEGERLEPVGDRVGEEAAQRGGGDRPAAEAGDHGVAVQVEPGERHPHVGGDDPADADRQRLLQHDHALGALQRRPHLLHREGPERLDRQRADRDALVAQLVDRVLDRPQHRAEGDDDGLGVLVEVAADQPAGGAAEGGLELGGDLGDHVERLHLLGVGEVLDLGEGLRPDHRADRHRVGRVEHLARLEGGEEGVDLLGLGHVDPLDRVGEDEAVHADHHRQRERLGDPERLHVQVGRLLVVLGVELQPAAVALGHRVGVVVPDVDRGADRAVGDRHHDRQAEAGGVVEGLGHVEQALAGGRRVGAGAGGGGADADRHRRELRLDRHVLAGGQLAARTRSERPSTMWVWGEIG